MSLGDRVRILWRCHGSWICRGGAWLISSSLLVCLAILMMLVMASTERSSRLVEILILEPGSIMQTVTTTVTDTKDRQHVVKTDRIEGETDVAFAKRHGDTCDAFEAL